MGSSTTLIFMGGAIVLLLGLIFVAQVAKAASKRKASAERAEERKVNLAFSEEEERRLAWIDHYVAAGQLDEARALGWTSLPKCHNGSNTKCKNKRRLKLRFPPCWTWTNCEANSLPLARCRRAFSAMESSKAKKRER